MLEVKHLSKVYKPKRGVPVKALDDVSLAFPETGMVFLLGKSGSGKSTLLNLLGGLDSCSSGEIVISGTSSRSFRGSSFDSYRNTLVGFIFQEYNVLEEFTVGANVALALELQGKKATDAEIGAILEKVELSGYGNRRPNELSGGQKQRVAIARALVKNPKIIMADEPTGALDSVTGRQVLDTLKELSREKLVIVVSHDRDFARCYADRIIELADGKVISDEVFFDDREAFEGKGLSYGEEGIRVSAGYRLTEEDRAQINEYLAALEEGKSLLIEGKRRADRRSRATEPTDAPQTFKPLSLIRSRLPLGPAFRIGASALKHKKLRLFYTIFLSCVAFCLFGLSDTFGSYDHLRTCTRSILDSEIGYASFSREERVEVDDDHSYFEMRGRISEEEMKKISEETKLDLRGVYVPYLNQAVLDRVNLEKISKEEGFGFYTTRLSGFAEIDEDSLEKQGLSLLAGRLPDGDKREIAISSYVCETYYFGGYATGSDEFETIRGPEDMVGKTLTVNGVEYTVTGVVSSGFDHERYRGLSKALSSEDTAEMILAFALRQELDSIQSYSLAMTALVGEGGLERVIAADTPFRPAENGNVSLFWETGAGYVELLGTLSHVRDRRILWLDGERDALAEGEVLLTPEFILNYFPEQIKRPDGIYDGGYPDLSVLSETELRDILQKINELPLKLEVYTWGRNTEGRQDGIPARAVGIVLPAKGATLGNALVAADSVVKELIPDHEGLYSFVVGAMPEDWDGVERLVAFSEREDDVIYPLQNSVTFELSAIHEILTVLSTVFFWIGVSFALFASLMLANFIGTSIVYKKQQIGILRAIGARSGDVFRIFFSESFCIAMINFLLSATGTFVLVLAINGFIRSETGLLVTILSFGIRQVLLLFGVSLLAAAVASFLPVKRIASKKPIDAIRGR